MTTKVVWSTRALHDLDRLADFLAEFSQPIARSATEVIVRAVEGLADFPGRGYSGPRPNFRQLLVPFGDSGYIVRYRVGRDLVLIIRVFHGREQR